MGNTMSDNPALDVVLETVTALVPNDWIVVSADPPSCVVAMHVWTDGRSAILWATEAGIAHGWLDDGSGDLIAATTGLAPLVIDDLKDWTR